MKKTKPPTRKELIEAIQTAEWVLRKIDAGGSRVDRFAFDFAGAGSVARNLRSLLHRAGSCEQRG